jgi:hypothetical protein
MITLTCLSPRCKYVDSAPFLKALFVVQVLADNMLELQNGKLLVYASSFASREARLKPVSMAAEKMAMLLKMDVEVKVIRKRFTSIYVYYKHGDEEPIPIYCNNGRESDAQKVYMALRNMMFVLSFHPKHSALKQAREEILHFS